MSDRARFSITDSVVLDVNGNGIIRLQPAGTDWEIDLVNVLCSTRVNNALCRVFVGTGTSDNMEVSRTFSGSAGDSDNSEYSVPDGTGLWVQWTGGDTGALATVTVRGWQTVVGRGFRAV